MNLKGQIFTATQSLLRRVGYQATRITATTPLDVLALVVETEVRRLNRPLIFVQAGANDGVRGDPIHDWIKQGKLTGLCIEPHPIVCDMLKRTYSEEIAKGTIKVAQAAVGNPADKGVTGFLTIERNDHLCHLVDDPAGKPCWQVKIATIHTLLEEAGLSQCFDFLQTDTEGHDDEVVHQALTRPILPSVIHYESGSLSSRQNNEVESHLRQKGYGTITVGVDTVAWLWWPVIGAMNPRRWDQEHRTFACREG